MKHLPQVTLIAATSVNLGETVMALKKSLMQITPARTVLFTHEPYEDPEGQIEVIKIPELTSAEHYSRFIMLELWKHINGSHHILIVQHDGYVLNGDAWTDDFLNYDYIGAPWMYKDGRNVGNGGFSLRSMALHVRLANDKKIDILHPEDEVICRLYRKYLEGTGACFAPEEVAHKFAYEMHRPLQPTFGFHNKTFNEPYKEPVIIKRTGAMGDIIMMEPVMRYYAERGYRVIINTLPNYYNLFKQHDYEVEHVAFMRSDEDLSKYRVINLDSSYEVKPKQLVLKSYYEMAGITDGPLRNPKLNYGYDKTKLKLFEKYVVLHVDDTAMEHRNIHGVDWQRVADFIEAHGYKVFQIGRGAQRGGLKINTMDENFLAYFIAGADYFIGLDSGPSNCAIATGVKSMIFFGSVNPYYRIAEHTNIKIMQKYCVAQKDGCYHSVISVKGTDCVVNIKEPPCITWTTEEVIEEIKKFIL